MLKAISNNVLLNSLDRLKMWKILLFLTLYVNGVPALWDKETVCPLACVCRLQHISETAIYRFMSQDKEAEKHYSEAHNHENNDVLYEDDFEVPFDDDNSIHRTATCILQTDTDIEKLLENLPKDLDSLTLIQGSDSGNKTIKFSHLLEFADLKMLELQGVQLKAQVNTSKLICEMDATLPLMQYLNLERIILTNSQRRFAIIENELNEEMVTFEYVQKVNSNSRPLSFIKKGPSNEILPYSKYVEQVKNNVPLFKGFNALILLRITNCELNAVHWEMFDGLHNLNYLILENNNLRFVPDFAFYGTPNLKTLSLAWNNLLNIQVTNLAGLLELEYLDLSHNNFSQLSELSLPPFPKLKLANFGNNPISVVFPNTFEVMNTTASLILGGEDTQLSLLTNSFTGLKLLKKLTLRNLKIPMLKKEIFVGMPNLNELILTGDIPTIEYDAFLEAFNLEKLFINNCNVSKLSVDSFMGLNKLRVLDLSYNNLDFLPPGIFDELRSLRELYLNDNKFQQLTKQIFTNPQLKLIRLNNNPWHCSCEMSDWKPMIINRIKQKIIKSCRQKHDKGVECNKNDGFTFKYLYENRVAPKCTTPINYENWNVFHVMRKQFRCSDFKPKIKKLKPFPIKNSEQRSTIIIPSIKYVNTEHDNNSTSPTGMENSSSESKTAQLDIVNDIQNISTETSTEVFNIISEDGSTEQYSRQSTSMESEITHDTDMTEKELKKKRLVEKFNTKLLKYLYRNETNNLNLIKPLRISSPLNNIYNNNNNNNENYISPISNDNDVSENFSNNLEVTNLKQSKIKQRRPLRRKIRKRIYRPKFQKK